MIEVTIAIICVAYISFKLGSWHTKVQFIKMMISQMTAEELKKIDELAAKLKHATDDEADTIIDQVLNDADLKMLKLELVASNQYLLYDLDNNFVCQGTTLEDLAKTFSLLNKSKACVVTETGDKFFIVDGEIHLSVA